MQVPVFKSQFQPGIQPSCSGQSRFASSRFGMIDQPLLPRGQAQLLGQMPGQWADSAQFVNPQPASLQLSSPSAASQSPVSQNSTPAAQVPSTRTTPEGLQITDTKVGTGAVATPGQTLTMHYTGTLVPSGKKFDSSLDRGEPFEFTLGAGEVIQGWDQGIEGMRVGGERTLIIPPELGYGERGAGEDIPPNATLKFTVQLLGVH